MLRYCFFIAGIIITLGGWAQVADSSLAPADMLDEITQTMSTVNRPEPKVIASKLQEQYESGELNDRQVRELYALFLRMQEDRFRLFPDLTYMLEAVHTLAKHPAENRQLMPWLRLVKDMVYQADIGRTTIFRFLEFSIPFFRDGLLYTSNTRNWRAQEAQYAFQLIDRQPVIVFGDLVLEGFSQGDSLRIYKTSGRYFPAATRWEGKSGLIRWEGTGLDPEKVYATFEEYQIDVAESEFTIDSAKLHYRAVFAEPVSGVLYHELRLQRNPSNNRLPQFRSYAQRIKLDDFVKGVDYEGGFLLEGPEIKGYGTETNPAMLYFKNSRNEVQMITRAINYSIKPKTVVSRQAAITLYMGEDSITHPGLELKYLVDDRQLIATQGETGIGQAPFYNTYHNLEMDFQRLLWDLDEPVMNMTRILPTATTPAYFYSDNFYDFETYDGYRGVLSYNPIQQLFQLKQSYGNNVIRADIVARAFNPNLTIPQIQGLLYRLVADGFIRYNAKLQEVTILPKVDRYELASREAIDHDHIRMKSETDTLNATLNLQTRELAINGVYATTLNAKHFVHAFPKNKKISVYENRDLQFGGTLFAGKLDLFGDDYYFDYKKYTVDLRKVDSMIINIETDSLDEYGEPVLKPIKTVFEGLSGTLYLDDPRNKAGYQDIPGYPKLVNDSASYAYYDNATGMDSTYSRDNFFFEIDPFEIDSLDQFEFSSQTFGGTFHSGGIFPEFRQDLQMREDQSLGFVTAAPDSGWPMYGGLGRYYQTVDLSSRGLRGNGRIEYLNAVLASNDFLFAPELTQGVTHEFTMQQAVIDTVHFPTVTADTIGVKWYPRQDSMLLSVINKPFGLFENGTTFKGQLNLRTTGLEGQGTAEWSQAVFRATDITFGGKSMRADTSAVWIKSGNPEKPALELPNVNASFDFRMEQGFMTNNQDSVPVQLPYTLYETNMDRFRWNMPDSIITMEPALNDTMAYFLSTHSGQDSLRFLSKSAAYNVNTYELTVKGIPHIPIADSWVIPPDLQITVGESARIKPLNGAKLIADSSRQQFVFEDAQLTILGRNEMRGSARYPYVNRSGQRQMIPFQNIATFSSERVDTVYTYGSGVVVDTNRLLIDPKIGFKGEVTFDSRDSLLVFDGVARIMPNSRDYVRSSWFMIDQTITPTDVRLDADNLVSANRDSVFTGIHQRYDSTNLYTTLTGTKQNYIDNTIFLANGQLRYDPEQQRFQVAPADYFATGTTTGNVLEYDDVSGDIHAFGLSDLNLNFGLARATVIGDIKKLAADTLYRIDAMVGLDFHLSDIVKDLMYADLRDISFNGQDIDPMDKTFQQRYGRLIADSAARAKVYQELAKTGALTFPKDRQPPLLLLSDVQMYWDGYSGSFIGIGEVGVVSFNGEYIGRTMKAYFEMGYRRTYDFFNLYLEGDNEWQFISYENKRVAILTSNVNVNSNIINTKIKDRTIKENGETLSFTIATEFAKQRFYNNMLYLEEQMNSK